MSQTTLLLQAGHARSENLSYNYYNFLKSILTVLFVFLFNSVSFGASESYLTELKKLIALKESGNISIEEFENRRKILRNTIIHSEIVDSSPEISKPELIQHFVKPMSQIKFEEKSFAKVVSKNSLNIRDRPSKLGKLIGSIQPDSQVIIISETSTQDSIDGVKGHWIKISASGKEGFVFGGFIEAISSQTNNPDFKAKQTYLISKKPEHYPETRTTNPPSPSNSIENRFIIWWEKLPEYQKNIVILFAIALCFLFWNFFLRWRCPNCRSTNFVVLKKDIVDKYSEKRGRVQSGSSGGREYRKKFQWNVRVTVYTVSLQCNICNKIWSERERIEERGPEYEI